MHLLKIFYTVLIFLICQEGYSQYKRCGTISSGRHTEETGAALMPNKTFRLSAEENTKIYRIPVVVHVIWNTPESNISEEIIKSQIRILNEDYRRLNADTINTFPIFKSIAADAKLEFFLAGIDPAGNTSNGIVRKYSPSASFYYKEVDNTVKPLSYWPSDQYLNIWVTTLTDGYLGVGPDPEEVYLNKELAISDGIVINYVGFGVNSSTYGRGRTATHEVGHWLGLFHIWGDSYCGNDFIEDTPIQGNGHDVLDISCPKYTSNCTGTITQDMSDNYMDYSPDACMNIFTKGQISRMRYVMETNTSRIAIQSSPALDNISGTVTSYPKKLLNVYPNPSNSVISFNENIFNNNIAEVTFFDQLGKEVLSFHDDGSQRKTYDISYLPNGMYLIKVVSDQQIYQSSFSVIR